MNSKNTKLWTLIIATLSYSYLFYEQSIGVNLAIFNCILIAVVFIQQPLKTFDKSTIVTTVGSLLSSFGVAWLNTDLLVFANIVSLFLFAGFYLNPKASLFVSLINSIYSFLAAPFVHIANKQLKKEPLKENASGSSPRLKLLKVASYTLPMLIALVFVGLYSNANPIFESLLTYISLDFISWPWLRYTFFAGFLLFGFVYKVSIDQLNAWDTNTSNTIHRMRRQLKETFHPLALKYEIKTATFLLCLLNFVLIIFLITDAQYLINNTIPNGLNHSQFVHQGVNALIVSILFAIAIIIYFFRSNVNFFSRNKSLIILSKAWIVLNILLIITILQKNGLYISEHGLTYKRIGVYVYAFLSFIGLITTFIKLVYRKNHWYLLRKNSWALYLILISLSCVDWDQFITRYSIKHASYIDIKYLNSLSHANLIELKELAASSSLVNDQELEQIESKEKNFTEKIKHSDWRSSNYRDNIILEQLKTYDDE